MNNLRIIKNLNASKSKKHSSANLAKSTLNITHSY